MKITGDEVKHIVKLSMLTLSEEELSTYSGQLNTIISYVEQLNTLDTGGVGPTSHVLPINNVMRDDMRMPSLSNEEALKNAPDPADNFYRVPKIIE
ncbi:MAG: Asp-tRNA(Asn)/Glu-tRNA(Gln) amidotransferase subunit GatC [Nitrospirae bacterium]|nr:Asp-tRNA(Asn)/Glu-tRNA(Gln) amidotransferase subunit GatC [Nitrospirota bacterium]